MHLQRTSHAKPSTIRFCTVLWMYAPSDMQRQQVLTAYYDQSLWQSVNCETGMESGEGRWCGGADVNEPEVVSRMVM